MKTITQRFGANVARLRKERGLTQEAFADLAGIARSYMSDVERGARNPTIVIVERIAIALKVPLRDLFD
ncbi:helix-turn-helix transcriptional regulator [Caenibius sp. WL]|uniref:helix-turn-helix domain-containing protein n=1 Tax=Caenibius sp. WL TaxID=2872646 RepID=UPI001E719872|nr:helix-turn-helix transcriptional regulator [Caenibius sp. WL]QZP07726.1 helix-turn-helix domain-containing protein [Caenibius sp. WL]